MVDIDVLAVRISKSYRKRGYVRVKELTAEMENQGISDPSLRAELMDAIEALDMEIRDDFLDCIDDDGEDLVMNSIRLYLMDVNRYRLLTRDEEHELAIKVKQGDREAKEKMITSNLRLVISIAKRYLYSSNIELQDLMQAGNLGLMKAVEKYDPDMGCKFSTYATWWIKQAVTRYISDNSNTIRIPVYIHDRQKDITRFIIQYERKHGREPSDQVLAKKFKLGMDIISAYRNVKKGVDSIDAFSGEDYDADIGSQLTDMSVDVEETAVMDSMSEDVNQVISIVLHGREEDIVRMRWGCDGTQEGKTLEEIGRKYHLTRERVRQIEKGAMDKLRDSSIVFQRLSPWIA